MTPRLSDRICLSGSAPSPAIKTRYLIYFLTGNPGLIEYYRTFFTHLSDLLSTEQKRQGVAIDIHGTSLPGFETNDSKAWRTVHQGLDHAPPYLLGEVVDAMERDLWRIAEEKKREGEELKIIIMGHSVGTFISLELIQRHRHRFSIGTKEVPIAGGILLFPTVMDLAKSPRGVALDGFTALPFFITFITYLNTLLLLLLPTVILTHITNRATPTAGSITAAFLRSPSGVRQALYMGADELRQITADKWDEEIWGAVEPSKSGIARPKLFFYFGESDHWVAERTRADLMKMRGGEEKWRPRMEVDTEKVPHDFCIGE
jgi:pimeloyl-ACP methyl ester carboxylesterase